MGVQLVGQTMTLVLPSCCAAGYVQAKNGSRLTLPKGLSSMAMQVGGGAALKPGWRPQGMMCAAPSLNLQHCVAVQPAIAWYMSPSCVLHPLLLVYYLLAR
jgi:hypothetical protein